MRLDKLENLKATAKYKKKFTFGCVGLTLVSDEDRSQISYLLYIKVGIHLMKLLIMYHKHLLNSAAYEKSHFEDVS